MAPTLAGPPRATAVRDRALPGLGADRLVEDAQAVLQQVLVDRDRRQQPDHVVERAGLEDHDPVLEAATDDARTGGPVERLLRGAVGDELDGVHHPAAPDLA